MYRTPMHRRASPTRRVDSNTGSPAFAQGLLLLLSAAVTLGADPGARGLPGNSSVATGYPCVENGTLISNDRVCDGVPDCGAMADDETFCLGNPQPRLCRQDLADNLPVYTCLDGDFCLPSTYFCDNYTDCGMKEDELYCDQQYIPGCSFGVLQVTCTDVTLSASYDKDVPSNIRFISLNGVHSPTSGQHTVSSLINLARYPYLIKVYLVKNNLTKLHLGEPNSLIYLRSLFVSNNKIRTIEATSLLAATNLVHLELPDNQIMYIESGAFQGMTLLTKLDIKGNLIQTLYADTFNTLYSLDVVNMSHNDIIELQPGIFDDLANVTQLSISYNSMVSLKKNTFNGLSKLPRLDIEHVPIRHIEDGALEGLTGLQSLSWRFEVASNTTVAYFKRVYADFEHAPIRQIERGALEGLTGLLSLELSHNELETLDPGTFQDLPELQLLTIVGNSISMLQKGSFDGLRSVINLNLPNNNISRVEPGAFQGLDRLLRLDLSYNNLTELQAGTFTGLPKLQILWMTHVPLKHIEPGAFAGLPNVVSLNILHAKLEAPTSGIFDGLDNLTSLSTSDRRLCCLLDPTRNASCHGPIESFSSCQRLMPNAVLRGAIWILGISAICGNAFVICQRAVKKGWRKMTVQSVLITHLAISDALMGTYMLAVGAADLHFGGEFFLHSEAWRTGGWCKGIGFLSVLSSEASVFLVMLISIDRLVSIAFPFNPMRLDTRFARITIAVFWFIALILSLISTIMVGNTPSLYGLSDVCVGLPLITSPVNESTAWTFLRDNGTFVFETSAASTRPAWAFSVFLYLGLNFVCFVVVLVCYILIFVIVRRSSRSVAQRGSIARKSGRRSTGTTRGGDASRSVTFSREVKLATRMAFVVGTDFLCWMPIIIMGILTQSGTITVPEELYAWTVVFILPINSSLNPYLYTISEVCAKRRQKAKHQATQCVRMTYALPRTAENDRMMTSAVDSDTLASFIGRR